MLTIHEGKESILNSFSCKCNHSLPCFCPSWWRPEKKQSKHPAFSCWHVFPDCGSQRMLIRGKYHRCPQEINAHTAFSPLFSQDVRVHDTLWKAWYRFCWKIFFSQLSGVGGEKIKCTLSDWPCIFGPNKRGAYSSHNEAHLQLSQWAGSGQEKQGTLSKK